MDMFNELIDTVIDTEDRLSKVSADAVVSVPAIGYLRRIADDETINRCVKKRREQRRRGFYGGVKE